VLHTTIQLEVCHINKGLQKMSGSNMEEMSEEWALLHVEELRGLYRAPSIVRVMKTMKLRWAKDVAEIKKKAYRVLYRIV